MIHQTINTKHIHFLNYHIIMRYTNLIVFNFCDSGFIIFTTYIYILIIILKIEDNSNMF